MRHFYCRLISQSLARHSKSIPQTQTHTLRYLQTNYTETNVPKSPILSSKCSAFTTSALELNPPPSPSEGVSAIVDELSELTLLEVMDLDELLRKKFGVENMPAMAVMMPGVGIGGVGGTKGGGGPAAKAEEKVEKTAFDLKLEGGFDAAVKIKIIKEVRACTALGLKEAKELVEKAPTLLKKGVTKEEAEKIVEKMKEVGAKITME